MLGDSIGTAKRADASELQELARGRSLEQELIDTRIALAKASERTGGDEMLDALAERLHADVMFRTGGAELDRDVVARSSRSSASCSPRISNSKCSCTASPTRAASAEEN